MSQNEPYVLLRLTSSAAKQGPTFATIKAARSAARRKRQGVEWNAIGQKRHGHAGITIVERVRTP